MSNAKWPDVICPPPRGPTARRQLEFILRKAQSSAGADVPRIEKAVEACLRSECLSKDPPQRGKPPPEHGERVLWARALAAEGKWNQCADALQHGTAPKRATKKTVP